MSWFKSTTIKTKTKLHQFQHLWQTGLTLGNLWLMKLSMAIVPVVNAADFHGNLTQRPQVEVHNVNGRTVTKVHYKGQNVTATKGINQGLKSSRTLVLFISAMSVLLCLAAYVYWGLKLAQADTNTYQRQESIKALGVISVALSFLGATSWILGIAYNFIGK